MTSRLTSPVKLVGKIRLGRFQASSGLSDSANRPGYEAGRNVSDGVVSGIGTLFSLDHKLYASDYDSGSVAGENKSLSTIECSSWFHLSFEHFDVISMVDKTTLTLESFRSEFTANL